MSGLLVVCEMNDNAEDAIHYSRHSIVVKGISGVSWTMRKPKAVTDARVQHGKVQPCFRDWCSVASAGAE